MQVSVHFQDSGDFGLEGRQLCHLVLPLWALQGMHFFSENEGMQSGLSDLRHFVYLRDTGWKRIRPDLAEQDQGQQNVQRE